MSVLGGARIVALLLDVFDRDQAFENIGVVHHQQFLDAVLLQERFGFIERCADADGDQFVFGHHLRDRQVEPGFKPQVTIGEDADKLAILRNRDSRNTEAFHQRQRFVNFVRGRHCDRVNYHAALTSFHSINRLGLPLDRHISVNEPQAALACERDRKPRLGHGIHGGAYDRDVER